ncbi:MAG: DUF3048 domain-containing protein [Lachnospiraceae bacterium]|nr:DUF3048 domain-containing protein [Lachnospiraceae bacterium]
MKMSTGKKAKRWILAALFTVILAMGVHAEDTCQSLLTGETVPVSIGRNRPVAIMFNNIYDAVPQYGISKAGVLVEAEVEGLITRIMGIMEDYKDAERIGSVRSARNYYYYFAREFQAIYCHYGEAAYALPLLGLDSTVELSGLSERDPLPPRYEGETTYYRSDDRVSPHNVFTNYEMLQAGIDYVGYNRALPEAYLAQGGHFKFASADEPTLLENGVTANYVAPGYEYNNASFQYNPGDQLYYRSQYGEAMIDGNTGYQLTCKNIILQYCDSQPFDDNGYLWTDVVSGGTGKYITNGKAIDITWKKPYNREDTTFITDIVTPNVTVSLYTGDFEVTHYYDTDGNEIRLNPGVTWILLIRNQAADQVVISE